MKRPSRSSQSKKKSSPSSRRSRTQARPNWTFLSNHAHVLVCLARDPDIRMREVAERIGITERAVLNIVSDLEAEGLVRRHREGRRNSYEMNLGQPLRHPMEKHRQVGDLVKLILD